LAVQQEDKRAKQKKRLALLASVVFFSFRQATVQYDFDDHRWIVAGWLHCLLVGCFACLAVPFACAYVFVFFVAVVAFSRARKTAREREKLLKNE